MAQSQSATTFDVVISPLPSNGSPASSVPVSLNLNLRGLLLPQMDLIEGIFIGGAEANASVHIDVTVNGVHLVGDYSESAGGTGCSTTCPPGNFEKTFSSNISGLLASYGYVNDAGGSNLDFSPGPITVPVGTPFSVSLGLSMQSRGRVRSRWNRISWSQLRRRRLLKLPVLGSAHGIRFARRLHGQLERWPHRG